MPFGSRDERARKVVKRAPSKASPPRKVSPTTTFGKVPQLEAFPGERQAKAAGRKAEQGARRIAAAKVPAPHVPKLANPTAAQKTAAKKIVTRSAERRDAVARDVRRSAERAVGPQLAEDAARSFGWKRIGTRKSGQGLSSGVVYEGLRKAKPVVGPDWLAKDQPEHYVYSGHGDPNDKRNWERTTPYHGPATSNPLGKLGENAVKDTFELAITTPTSLAKLATTAVHDPGKVPGMLAQPYKEFAKNPVKAYIEHPVSTSLMFAPAARVPGRAAGKVARLTGKQTLKRAPATLPRTALREARTGSRDVVVNAWQKRQDRKAGPQTMTDKDVQRRVDEFFDVSQKHTQRVADSAAREGKRRAKVKGLSRAERREYVQEHVEGAKGGAGKQLDRRFAEEFGATAQRTPEGVILKPKQADKGALHSSKADADAIAERAPFEAVVRQVGDHYAVLPKVAAERLHKQQVVGTSPSSGAKIRRVSGKAFRSTVLPVSAKWLFGQGTEAGLRSAVAGAGPASFVRGRRVIKELERQQHGKGTELRQRAAGGGQFGLTGTAREFADGGRTLAEEFAGTALERPAAALTRAGAKPPARVVRRGWKGYSNFVFNTVNGAIEQTAQTAMLGKAIKQSPLMERRVVGLSDKAIKEAAAGLRGTESQVALGRAVDRMYGQYSKFSPEKREHLMHTTPFYPWYRNMATFLTKVLPVDHPVKAALIADVGVATEEWRKAHGLSLRGGKTRPPFLLGGYPVGKGDQVIRLGRYLPFLPADPLDSVADLFYPQFSSAAKNLGGLDWTNKPLKHPGYTGREFNAAERATRAGVTLAESMIPLVGPVGRVTGITKRYVDKDEDPSIFQGKPILPALGKEYNPLAPTAAREPKRKGKRRARKPKDILGGSGGQIDILK